MDLLYRKTLNVQGIIMDLGCRWGQNTSLFTALPGIHEPYNRLKKVVAFDTFAGFPNTQPQDGVLMKPGGYATTARHEEYLEQVL
jgi:hypothetical protein